MIAALRKKKGTKSFTEEICIDGKSKEKKNIRNLI